MKKVSKYIKDMDKVLLITTISLILFGLLNIVTASSREAVTNMDESIYYYFYRHSAILIMGLIGSLILIKINTKKYPLLLPIAFILTFGMNLFLVLKGTATRGANNWIDLGFFKLQPSELAKPVIIVCLAFLFDKLSKDKNIRENISNKIGTILLIGLAIPAVVFLQKDLGTAIILFGIFGILFLTSPLPKDIIKKTVLIVTSLGIFVLLIMYSVQGYILSDAQLSRFNYFNPCSNYTGDGYQVCNAFIAINNGGLTGVGIGKSTQKYSYIPEPHTDMVFSIISEEQGVLKCSLIFIAYIIIIYRILKLSTITNRIRDKYICIGAATYIFLHILVNLGGLFGLIPLTGVPLPFLSYGGSYTLSLIAMLTVIQRIHIEIKKQGVIRR